MSSHLQGKKRVNRHASRSCVSSSWRKPGQAPAAQTVELVTELADVYELLEALINTTGISEEQVRQVQDERRAERGGFQQRLRLVWTEEALPA